jgi:hypothetical protein
VDPAEAPLDPEEQILEGLKEGRKDSNVRRLEILEFMGNRTTEMAMAMAMRNFAVCARPLQLLSCAAGFEGSRSTSFFRRGWGWR